MIVGVGEALKDRSRRFIVCLMSQLSCQTTTSKKLYKFSTMGSAQISDPLRLRS